MFSRTEMRLLWEISEHLSLATSYNDIHRILEGPVRSLFPHNCVATGICRISTNSVLKILNVDFPDEFVNAFACEGKPLSTPTAQIWKTKQTPLDFSLQLDAGVDGVFEAWRDKCKHYNLQRLVVHGAIDHSHDLSTYISFGTDAKALSERDSLLLRMLVPYLHDALIRAMKRSNPINAYPIDVNAPYKEKLSPREMEVLHWVRAGKTNYEISVILYISEHTVKNHLKKIMAKLNASNRAHASANANLYGIFENAYYQ